MEIQFNLNPLREKQMLVINLINDHVPLPSSLCRFIQPRQENRSGIRHVGVLKAARGLRLHCVQAITFYAAFLPPLFLDVRTVRRWASVAFVPFGPRQCAHNVTTSSCKGVIPLMRCPLDLPEVR